MKAAFAPSTTSSLGAAVKSIDKPPGEGNVIVIGCIVLPESPMRDAQTTSF